MNLGYFNFQCS